MWWELWWTSGGKAFGDYTSEDTIHPMVLDATACRMVAKVQEHVSEAAVIVEQGLWTIGDMQGAS